MIGLLVLAVACVVKFTGAYIGSRVGGLSHWEGLAMGSGMNDARRDGDYRCDHRSLAGVLNQPMYSIIVMVAIVTSLMAPPLALDTFKVEMGEEESQRLQQESRRAVALLRTSTVC